MNHPLHTETFTERPSVTSRQACGQRLRIALTGAGTSIQSLAGQLRVSRQTVHRWLKGEGLNPARITQLAQTLGISENWLLRGRGEPAEDGDNFVYPVANPVINASRDYLNDIADNEKRLDHGFRIAQMACWELDLLSREVSWSGDLTQILGYRTQHLSWSGFLQHLHAEDRAELQLAMDGLLADGTPIQVAHARIHWPDGSTHWAEIRARLRLDHADRKRAVIGSVQDITVRKQAEARLLDTTALLDLITQRLELSLWSTDAQGRLNSLSGNLLPHPPGIHQSLLGQPLESLPWVRDQPALRKAVQTLLSDGSRQELLLEHGGRPVLFRLEALTADGGELQGSVGAALDLSNFPPAGGNSRRGPES